ncbi:hypothetical protein AMATHDRAFT_74133 [Amanita thiersii Skay4041]|uniref:TOG domain-containing protein n=1 Tax=Amanita thiersii Skay4041 TaxID=703135 RepID=A0A2A9NTK1_9AGAR|nr:hypothetical protein AMATHDRAFT_74133 [Amanita thiersii Skay4041]
MDSDSSRLEKLVQQCKSNDVDVKVNALTKLQSLFESNIQIDDPDTLVNLFKSCLRTSNQLLTTATLSALPPLLPLLITRPVHAQSYHGHPLSRSTTTASSVVVDGVILRQALNAFLPSGGIIERLGDKEKVQARAHECLVILGGLAFRLGSPSTLVSRSVNGKSLETPFMMFERFLRDAGLASKIWKVREQSILVLVHIRRSYPAFPIRPYLSLLVDCLEDTDPHVRDCARQSIIELFSGPAVTDAARTDLKKELAKKGVRKAIVDSVLMKLLTNASSSHSPKSCEDTENRDMSTTVKKEYIPPSLLLQGHRPRVVSQGSSTQTGHAKAPSQGSIKEISSRPASRAAVASPPPAVTPAGNDDSDVQPVYIASVRDLENEFVSMAKLFEGKETEHNWTPRDQSITRVRGMLKGGVHERYFDAFIALLKENFVQWSIKTLGSLRTTVSMNTCALYCEMAAALGPVMDPFCETLLINLFKMASFTKKITAQQSQVSVTAIIAYTSAQPRIVLPLLWNTLQEKTAQARVFVVNHFKQYLQIHGHRSKHIIESTGGLEILEKSIKKSLSDANPAVKEGARLVFWVFNDIWNDRGSIIMDSLDATARKQLEKVCPDSELVALPPTTPKITKKSSVAAAIAASRAKAKASATAPPTLRQKANPMLDSSPRPEASTLQNPTTRPISPLRMSNTLNNIVHSKSRVGSLVLNHGVQRIAGTSSTLSTTTQTQTTPSTLSGSKRALSPTSPDHSTYRRRISTSSTNPSSPNRPSTIRRAIHTALPDSPPHNQTQVNVVARPTSGIARKANPVPVPTRESSILPDTLNLQDESLLLAQTVPLPDGDTDSEGQSINLMSLSTSFIQHPPLPKVLSPLQSLSIGSKPTATISNALSSGSLQDGVPGQPILEDAMRARAEQAESAAERLLELVEPEEEGTSTIPASLLVGSSRGNGVKAKAKPVTSTGIKSNAPPTTPFNRNAAVLRQAALFENSPVFSGRTSSLLDVLQNHSCETGWWAKRQALISGKVLSRQHNPSGELPKLIVTLQADEPDVSTLQQLILISMSNNVTDSSPPQSPAFDGPASPSPFHVPQSVTSLHCDIWEKDKTFDQLFQALIHHLNIAKDAESTDYGLMLLWELLRSQALYIEGKEGEVFTSLLRVRYSNRHEVLEATSIIRDHLTSKIEPVYGLTTMHASLRAFQIEPPPNNNATVKATSCAFGLIALGKFILRLPAEVAEEELPRLRQTLITALNDRTSLIVRESAAVSIIAAQLVLRDETHLFALLDGLADDKKNLLTYLFDKHGARGTSSSSSNLRIDKLEKEIRRLDTRLSTPFRTPPSLGRP